MIFWLFLVFHHAPQNQTYRCSSDIKLNALIFMLPWAIVTCLLVLITNAHLYASSPSTDLELFQVALHSAHSLSSERRVMLSSANVPNDLLMGTLSAIFTFRSINDSSAKPPIFLSSGCLPNRTRRYQGLLCGIRKVVVQRHKGAYSQFSLYSRFCDYSFWIYLLSGPIEPRSLRLTRGAQ